jgi:hypothetical protein
MMNLEHAAMAPVPEMSAPRSLDPQRQAAGHNMKQIVMYKSQRDDAAYYRGWGHDIRSRGLLGLHSNWPLGPDDH